MEALDETRIKAALEALPGWQLIDRKITRDYTFSNFAEALAFVNRVGAVAESHDHHPDIDIRYNKVRLGLISHDADGITQRDLRMARLLQTELT